MHKRISNITLIVLVVVFLLSGMIRTALFPMEVNEYENRKAEKLTRITAESFLSGEWQDNMEAALADQAFFAQDMKKNYNNVLSLYLKNMTLSVADENQESYVSIGEQFLFGPETIVAGPSTFEYLTPALDKHIASYNKLFSKYPDTEFYVYYIEKDTDINFETNEKVGVAQYLAENISLPAENKSAFSINNFK